MKIFLMADNWIGLKVTEHLKNKNEEIVGLAVHPHEYQNLTNEIIEESGVGSDKVFVVSKDIEQSLIEEIVNLKPDIILVVFWRYILPESLFLIAPKGAMAYLPFNRGKNPNVWPIIEGTPAGVCMHYIDSGIDTGRIIARKEVPVEIIDTGKTVYNKQLQAFEILFKETWSKLKKEKNISIAQENEKSTYHTSKDFESLREIMPDKEYKAIDLINILRSKTFEPHNPCYFMHNGKKIFISVKLKKE